MSKYDQINEFINGVATVIKDNRYGVILVGGLEIIPPTYEYISPFHEGYAVAIKNGKCINIDLSGKEYTQEYRQYISNSKEFDEVRNYHDGIACVCTNHKWGAIDTNGNIIIQPQFYYLSNFVKGTATYQKDRSGEWGFVSTSASKTYFQEIDEPIILEDGSLLVRRGPIDDDEHPNLIHVTNENRIILEIRNQKIILSPEYRYASLLSEELILVQNQEGLYGCITIKGAIVIPLIFDKINDFRNGCGVATKGDQLYFVKSNGQIIALPSNIRRCTIIKNVAIASEYKERNWSDEKCYVINLSGEIIGGPINTHYTEYFKEHNEIVLDNANDKTIKYIVDLTSIQLKQYHANLHEEETQYCRIIGKCKISKDGIPYALINNDKILLPNWCIGGIAINNDVIVGESADHKIGFIFSDGDTFYEPIFDDYVNCDDGTVYGWYESRNYGSKATYGLYDCIFNTIFQPIYASRPYRIGLCYIASDWSTKLFDLYGNQILDDSISAIEIESEIYLKIRLDIMVDCQYKLLYISGIPVIDKTFDDIIVLKPGLFKCRDHLCWKLYSETGVLCHEDFSDIQYDIENDLINVKSFIYEAEAEQNFNYDNLPDDLLLDDNFKDITTSRKVKAIKRGQINLKGQFVIRLGFKTISIPEKFKYGEQISNNTYKVWVENDIPNYVNTHFEIGIWDNGHLNPINTHADSIIPIEGQSLYIYTTDNNLGLIDTFGSVLVTAKYSEILPISTSLFVVCKDSLYGIIDQYGDIILPSIYTKIWLFEDAVGICATKGQDNNQPSPEILSQKQLSEAYGIELSGKYGIISGNGSLTVPPKYLAIRIFNNGYFVFNGKWGAIDCDGDIIVPCQYDKIYSHDNLIIAHNESTFDIYNTNDANISYPCIHIKPDDRHKYGIYDFLGEEVVTPKYDKIESIQRGVIIVSCEQTHENKNNVAVATRCLNTKKGVVNCCGIEIIPPIYDEITILESGLYIKASLTQDELLTQIFDIHGHIILKDRDGIQMLSPRLYDWQGDFNNNGYSRILVNGRFGHVDQHSNLMVFATQKEKQVPVILPKECTWGLDSNKEYIIVEQNDKKGIMDIDGAIIIPCQYQNIEIVTLPATDECVFICNTKGISQNCLYDLISANGMSIFSNVETIKHLGFDLFAIRQDNRLRIYNAQHVLISDGDFDHVNLFGETEINNYADLRPSRHIQILTNCNYAIAIKDSKAGIINRFGEIIIPFSVLISTSSDIQSITIHSHNTFKIGQDYYNESNQRVALYQDLAVVIPDEFNTCLLISPDFMIVSNTTHYGCINNHSHRIVVPLNYDKIEICDTPNLVKVISNNNEGIFDLQTGKNIIPVEYEHIKQISSYFIAYSNKDNTSQLINNEGYAIVKFKNGEQFESITDNLVLFSTNNGASSDRLFGAYLLTGEQLSEAIYNEISPLYHDLIKIRIHDVYGAMNLTGNIILPTTYTSIEPIISINLLKITSNEGYGLALLDGTVILNPQKAYIETFENGIAIIHQSVANDPHAPQVYGAINTKGEIIIRPVFYDNLYYNPQTGTFISYKGELSFDGHFVSIDDGKIVLLHKQFDSCTEYIDHITIAKIGIERDSIYALINADQKIILPPICEQLQLLFQNYYKFKIQGKWGLCDSKGNIILHNKYCNIKQITNQLIRVCINSDSDDIPDLYGLFSPYGNAVLPIEYTFINNSSERYCIIERNHHWMLLNTTDLTLHLINGVAYVGNMHNGLCKFYTGNSSNNLEIIESLRDLNLSCDPTVYEELHEYRNKKTAYFIPPTKGGGYLDKNGNMVIPPQYDIVEDFSEGLAAVKKNGKYGFINRNNETIVPFEYDALYSNFKNGIGGLIIYSLKLGYNQVFEFNTQGEVVRTYVQPSNDDPNDSDYNFANEDYSDDSPTYDKYGGPNGYSDQFIDDVFDGDPSYAWNID
jgi:hypothetical protein